MVTAGAALALAVSGVTPAMAGGHGEWHGDTGELVTVLDGLSAPRGVDALGHGRTLVTESDGTSSTFSLVVEHHGTAERFELGHLAYGFSPAIAAGRHHTVWLLTGADDDTTTADDATAARLFEWRHGWAAPVEVADIGDYQATEDPDPYDLEDLPGDSNPFGLAALRDGSVLVADAAGNDLLHVSRHGHIETVARLKPREVTTPDGLPGAGTPAMSEAVATSVTVGRDGYWYVGELRGYPATAGTSEIWRIRPGTTEATCDPEHPWGACRRFADGLTSLVDLGAGPRGIYAVTLSKMTWLAIEGPTPAPGAEIGGLFLVQRAHRHHHHSWHAHGTVVTELVPDQLTLPSGVDVAEDPYVVGPIFGPGALMKIE
jgi:hypothetical protein